MNQANRKKVLIGLVAGLVVICCIFTFFYKNVFIKQKDTTPETPEVTEQTEVTEETQTESIPEQPEPAYVDPVDGSAEADKSVYMDATKDIETRIDALMAQMTLKDKAAQMVQPEQSASGSSVGAFKRVLSDSQPAKVPSQRVLPETSAVVMPLWAKAYAP